MVVAEAAKVEEEKQPRTAFLARRFPFELSPLPDQRTPCEGDSIPSRVPLLKRSTVSYEALDYTRS